MRELNELERIEEQLKRIADCLEKMIR